MSTSQDPFDSDVTLVEPINLSPCDEYPAIWDKGQQDIGARVFASRLIKRLKKKGLSKPEQQWLNIYHKRIRGFDIDEDLEEEENNLVSTLLEKITELTQASEENKIRYDAMFARYVQEQERRKDERDQAVIAHLAELYDKNLKVVEQAHSKGNEQLHNAGRLSNALNEQLVTGLTNQWRQAGDMTEKHYKFLTELLESQEKPGFITEFIENVIVPAAPKLLPALANRFGFSLPEKG